MYESVIARATNIHTAHVYIVHWTERLNTLPAIYRSILTLSLEVIFVFYLLQKMCRTIYVVKKGTCIIYTTYNLQLNKYFYCVRMHFSILNREEYRYIDSANCWWWCIFIIIMAYRHNLMYTQGNTYSKVLNAMSIDSLLIRHIL